MEEVQKERIAFIKDCLNIMNEGNFEMLKSSALASLGRLEKQLILNASSTKLKDKDFLRFEEYKNYFYKERPDGKYNSRHIKDHIVEHIDIIEEHIDYKLNL